MIAQKDIFKLLKSVEASLNIGYKSAHSDSENIFLDAGEILQISPYYQFGDDDYRVRCLEKDISRFKEKYFPNQEDKDEFYAGFSLYIHEEQLKNNYEIIEKADLTKLDFSKNEDRVIFVNQVWISHKKIDLLPKDLQAEFKLILKKYENVEITSNEVFNIHLYLMEEYYTK
jgi:hypothetical protein